MGRAETHSTQWHEVLGHSSRQRWVEVASSPALLAAEVGAIQQAAEAATAIHANIAKG
ncbi:hypothetical protein HaLaN_00140 [Haematococcus lacustris]|uniref:Uncharacterized protein n=1 Tax=Haematococcus lacustris TaxID=44745 RepID=A0A699Y8P7_HAELA|nr:hypothetical protein HaLaN_00140 [Haematococcus lacustris]